MQRKLQISFHEVKIMMNGFLLFAKTTDILIYYPTVILMFITLFLTTFALVRLSQEHHKFFKSNKTSNNYKTLLKWRDMFVYSSCLGIFISSITVIMTSSIITFIAFLSTFYLLGAIGLMLLTHFTNQHHYKKRIKSLTQATKTIS